MNTANALPPTDRDFIAIYRNKSGVDSYYRVTVEEHARYRALYGSFTHSRWTLNAPAGVEVFGEES